MPFGLFEFPFMCFGLRNAAQTLQRFIDEALRGLDFCYTYIGDILVATISEEEHEQHLCKLFERLREYRVLINVSKSVFGKPEVKFLEYFVSAFGTKSVPEKGDVMRNFPKCDT